MQVINWKRFVLFALLFTLLLLAVASYGQVAQAEGTGVLSTVVLPDSDVRVRLLADETYQVSLDDGQTYSRVLPQNKHIKLRYQTFDPLANGRSILIPNTLQAVATNEVYIVQFVTQPLAAYQEAVQELGATIYMPLADQALIMQMDEATYVAVEALPYVRWIGPYHPAYKLEEVLVAQLLEPVSLAKIKQRYSIMLLARGSEMQTKMAAFIRSINGVVETTIPEGYRLEATLTDEQLLQVAQRNEVLFIDRWTPTEADMDIAREISGANYLESVQGYTGAGVRAEVMDLGLRTTHQNIQGSPALIHGGSVGFNGYHGTAVYSIVFGDGAVVPAARGLIPDAQGIFAAEGILSGQGGTVSRYAHTAELVSRVGPYRAVFQTNSWGNDRTLFYTTISAEMDDILFQNDILILQSQSNAGDQMSRPQAWSKNILSVGGIRHYNTLSKADDAWAFGASVGPAADGRIKPDLSHFYDDTYTARYNTDTTYGQFGGTSGATPITAGYAGIFYQMWAEGVFAGGPGLNRDVFNSRPHMTTAKAVLINTADQYNFSGTTADLTRTHQGWGMVDMANAYDVAADNGWTYPVLVDETAVINPLEVHTYSVQVTSDTWFKATMVYADPMGPASSSQHRINDLSLRVTSPSGVVYWGNNGLMAGNWSTPGGSSNTLDTVENVFIEMAEVGIWTVEVLADEVVQDGHVETSALDADYALVVTKNDDSIYLPTPSQGENIYLSSSTNGNVDGLAFQDEDILMYNTNSGQWRTYFNGSDVGVTNDVNGFTMLSSGAILLTFDTETMVPSLGSVDDSDIVQFTPNALGGGMAGTFSLYFDGSDVGLTTDGEDIDAIAIAADGKLVISTIGNYDVADAAGADEDLFVFTATSLGADTSGSWARYVDGADVGLGDDNSENIYGSWIDDETGHIYLTTNGSFSVNDVDGDGADIFVCAPDVTGDMVACGFKLYWDGSVNGFDGENVDGFAIAP